jgi:hypothetical protein
MVEFEIYILKKLIKTAHNNVYKPLKRLIYKHVSHKLKKMNSSLIKQIEKTRTLKLSIGQLFWHYLLFLLPLTISLSIFYRLFKLKNTENYVGIRTENEILTFGIISLTIAIIVFLIKKRRLNFTQIDVSLNDIEFKEQMKRIGEVKNWKLDNNTKKFAIFYNGSDLTWGLKMTIIRFEKYLLINSICDPDTNTCISILNENERNINRLKKSLKKPVANTV